jgi:hypothetical protein
MIPDACSMEDLDRLDPERPLAVFTVGGDNDLGHTTLQLFSGAHGSSFHQILFYSVGVMDYAVLDAGTDPGAGFEGKEEAHRLKERTRRSLDPYIAAARRMGLLTGCRVNIATNPVDEIVKGADEIAAAFPNAVFFVSKMVFRKRRWFHRLLHQSTSDEIRRGLEGKGHRVRVLPLMVS